MTNEEAVELLAKQQAEAIEIAARRAREEAENRIVNEPKRGAVEAEVLDARKAHLGSPFNGFPLTAAERELVEHLLGRSYVHRALVAYSRSTKNESRRELLPQLLRRRCADLLRLDPDREQPESERAAEILNNDQAGVALKWIGQDAQQMLWPLERLPAYREEVAAREAAKLDEARRALKEVCRATTVGPRYATELSSTEHHRTMSLRRDTEKVKESFKHWRPGSLLNKRSRASQ